jgi:release factor glutamine methyltransferase
VASDATKPFTVAVALAEARIAIPLREARRLLQHVLSCTHAALAAHPEWVLTLEEAAYFRDLVARRSSGEPLAYLSGSCEFYGRSFAVTPEVLIPRPETELLADLALQTLQREPGARVLDLGTGSGILAITLALDAPAAQVVAVDASAEALEVAASNARTLGAVVRFVRGKWYSALGFERFDVIVANPPYVAAADPHLRQGDLRFEPRRALTDGSPDGLASLREIVAGAPRHLAPGGLLAVEHGYDQGDAVAALFLEAGFADIADLADLAGIPRVVRGLLPGVH